MFFLVLPCGSGDHQGKRKHQEPISGSGDPEKRSLLPTRYSHQQTESLPLSLSPTCVCLHLLPFPPCSSPFLFTPPQPPPHSLFLLSFSSQGPKGEGGAEKVALPSPTGLTSAAAPSPAATSLLICSGGFLSLEQPGYF